MSVPEMMTSQAEDLLNGLFSGPLMESLKDTMNMFAQNQQAPREEAHDEL
jgi:hypothetical protein